MATVDVSRIGSNIGALNSLSSLTAINNQLAVHQTRLSTGKRINSAADDPAGLTIATKLNSRSEGLKIALSNIGDAKNLLAVAESGLGRVNDILVQMRNKSEQAASDTMGVNERSAIVTQLKAYAAQINDITKQTEWNGTKLINGTFNAASGKSLTFQTGAGGDDVTSVSGLENMSATGTGSLQIGEIATSDEATIATGGDTTQITAATNVAVTGTKLASGKYTIRVTEGTTDTVDLVDANNKVLVSKTAAANVDFGNGLQVSTASLTGSAGTVYEREVTWKADDDLVLTFNDGNGEIDLFGSSSASDFNRYMSFLGEKLDAVSAQLSNIGALTGRLGFKEEQITASQINTEAAYNRIMNANMAEEQVNASKLQILQQTSTAMLAQANAAPQFLLSLFR